MFSQTGRMLELILCIYKYMKFCTKYLSLFTIYIQTFSRTGTGNWLQVFLEKAKTTGTSQNFIIRCRYCSCCYLFVSLWHCSHMSLSYLTSDDGLIFFCFSFCGALEFLLCLKSKKYKGSDSLPSLMGNYHKSYLHAYLFQNF